MITAVETEQGQGESALLGRARAVFRRTGRDLKDALAMAARLEDAASRCYVAGGSEISDEIVDSVIGLLRTVREEHPDQELEVVIFAAPEEARGGERNGQQDSSAAGSLRRD